MGCYGADGTQESGVNSTAKENKFTTDFLDELLALGIKRREFGGFSGILYLGAIFNRGVGEWRVLRRRRFLMLELCEGFGDISWHGEVNLSLGVVPVKGDASVMRAGPVCGDLVVFSEDLEEMLRVFFSAVFDTKIVRHKGELDGMPFVGPESRDELTLAVAMLVEVFFEEFIG